MSDFECEKRCGGRWVGLGFVRRDVSTVYRVTRVRVANDDLRAECVRERKRRRERERVWDCRVFEGV